MKSPYHLVRLSLSFVLLPVSLAYGLICIIRRALMTNSVILTQKVISVGNIQVGGTGKTPVVLALCKILGDKAVVVTKNYGTKYKRENPQEVTLDSDVERCGDEALEIKFANPEIRVFSGPNKSRTAFFASKKVLKDSVLIIDDGAQHLKLKRDLNIIVWDLSRSFLDFLPFPLGLTREFWFAKVENRLDIFNRVKDAKLESNFFLPDKKSALISDYSIKSISNINSESKNLVLISGIGNFEQLKNQVDQFLKDKNLPLISRYITGADHDDFSGFKPKDGEFYLMTQKDYTKLSAKILDENIGLIRSDFSSDFYKILEDRVKTKL